MKLAMCLTLSGQMKPNFITPLTAVALTVERGRGEGLGGNETSAINGYGVNG